MGDALIRIHVLYVSIEGKKACGMYKKRVGLVLVLLFGENPQAVA